MLEYLNTTALNESTRAFIRDDSHFYRKRAITLYKALDSIREQILNQPEQGTEENRQGDMKDISTHPDMVNGVDMSEVPPHLRFMFGSAESPQGFAETQGPLSSAERKAQKISQAMADIVHTVGFANQAYRALLRSSDPMEQIEGVQKILNERDIIAFELGFKGDFPELKQHLKARIPDHTQNLRKIQQDIDSQQDSQQATHQELKVLRLRALSLQESPFRACFGGDCSSKFYFKSALDPNLLYFTLTDSHHKSFGRIAVVLGEATTEEGKRQKVGFVDRVQGVDNRYIQVMLEGVRLSLKEKGYQLVIPKDLGPPNSGISNSAITIDYLKSEVLPALKTKLKGFKPHDHGYHFNHKDYLRANETLELLKFEEPILKDVEAISPGELFLPKQAHPNQSVLALYEPILSLKESTNESDQLQFLNHLLTMRKVQSLGLSDQYVREHLHFVMNSPYSPFPLRKKKAFYTFSFPLRKKAFYTWIEFSVDETKRKEYNPKFEMDVYENWININPNSRESKWAAIIQAFLDKWNRFSKEEQKVLGGEMGTWKNTTDHRKMFIIKLTDHLIADREFSLDYLKLESPFGALLDESTILINVMRPAHRFDNQQLTPIVSYLLTKGVNPNAEYEGGTVLHKAIIENNVELVKALLKAGAKPNARFGYWTALDVAASNGQVEIVKELLKAGAKPNARSPGGWTALDVAVRNGPRQVEVVKELLKAGANLTGTSVNYRAAMKWAKSHRQEKIVKELLKVRAKNLAKRTVLFAFGWLFPRPVTEQQE